MKLTTAKLLAVIGLILGLLAGKNAVGLIGLILYLIGMHGISRFYNSNEIFKFALYASIASFIALAAVIALVGAGVVLAPFTGGISLGASIIAALTVIYIAILATGYYKRRLLERLEPYSDRSLARLSAKLYWYGAILAIVVIGIILLLIAIILEVIVIATLKEQQQWTIT